MDTLEVLVTKQASGCIYHGRRWKVSLKYIALEESKSMK